MTHHTGDVVAIERTEVLRFPSEQFDELISRSRPIVQHLVNSMTDRVKFFTQQQLLSEKLASLGKLSAGLAHELNKPRSSNCPKCLRVEQALIQCSGQFKTDCFNPA